MLLDVNTKVLTAAFSNIVLSVLREMHHMKAFVYAYYSLYVVLLVFHYFCLLLIINVHFSFFFFLFMLSPTLFCVDRFLSSLKIANHIMEECAPGL